MNSQHCSGADFPATPLHPSGLCRTAGRLAAALAALIVGAGAVAAQVIVVQSSDKSLKAGSAISNNTRIKIAPGTKALFVLPSGATRTVSGPFDGLASELTKGVKVNVGVFEAVKRYVKTGGTNQKTVGAIRSAAVPIAPGKPLPFSWRNVAVTASGDICLERGAQVALVRSRTAEAQTITLVDMKSRRPVRATFPAGAARIPGPSDLAMDQGLTYALLRSGRKPRQIRLRLISPLPATEDVLQVLHHQRCQSQFRAWIRGLQSASN